MTQMSDLSFIANTVTVYAPERSAERCESLIEVLVNLPSAPMNP